MKTTKFDKAKPIWPEILKNDMNVHVMLATDIAEEGADILRIATHGFYQLFVNGEYVAYGPARAGRGYFRVDEICLTDKLVEEKNKIEILIYSYGVDNFSNINQEPFVTCEICKGAEIIKATGLSGFQTYKMTNYVQSVSRYSWQRGFSESYILDDEHKPEKMEFQVCSEKKYIERNVAYPQYEKIPLNKFILAGDCKRVKRKTYKKLMAEDVPPENSMQFRPVEENMTFNLQEFEYSNAQPIDSNAVSLECGQYTIGEFEREISGMITFKCKAEEDSLLYITFDEKMDDNKINPQRIDSNFAIRYVLKKGNYNLINFEPETMKYICFQVFEGCVDIEDVVVVEYKHPPISREVHIEDKKLKDIYEAAVETFKQNAIDIFTDCPQRERAGWLCDSFFTARAEKFLTGHSLIEKNFLENFLMEEPFKYLPSGMLPMCYPADHLDKNYIPNWSMWFVIQLEEYFQRTNDRELIEAFKDKMFRLADFFAAYENQDGLLEKLDKWVFVDWSESNKNVQDVSFPSNMMYAYMLEKLASLYECKEYETKAKHIKAKVRELSYNGQFFCDNLIKTENGYRASGVCTESCQYYAFFTKTATKEAYPELWNTLVEDFGYQRVEKGLYPEVPISNAFVGNFVRLEILAREKCYERLLEEIKGYFGYMAEKTGTLWEKIDEYDDNVSMNHGFSSQVAVWIYECLNKKECD